MKLFIRRYSAFMICLLVLLGLCVSAAAEETEATDLRTEVTVTGTGYNSYGFLTDDDTLTYRRSAEDCSLTLESETGMASVYLLFDAVYGDYTIINNDTGDSFTAGTGRYLHEYVDLAAAFGESVHSITLRFENGKVRLGEIYPFSEGQVPDFVQRWAPPLEGGADILLFAAHSDDDQLFFAGLFPLYAKELGCRVQVAYMTDHRQDDLARSHEVLNGLWITGATNYPVFADFPDFRRDDKEETYAEYLRRGYTEEDLLTYVVEQIRRFDPLVVVGHDFLGEYGHGMHMVYADLVAKAVEITMDPEKFPASAETYGTWDVPKTYIHAYEENPIVLDYDTPLESFDGLTAFQASQQLGFPCHLSQQIYKSFQRWFYGPDRTITKASEITQYPPHKFGLLRSTVGEDVLKNDFMENITSYGEQERLEQERLEQERLEQERLEQERLEQERLEQERLEQERLEQERLEQERLEQERLEQERLEQERLEQERIEQAQQQKQANARKRGLLLAVMILCAIAAICLIRPPRKKKSGKFSKKR